MKSVDNILEMNRRLKREMEDMATALDRVANHHFPPWDDLQIDEVSFSGLFILAEKLQNVAKDQKYQRIRLDDPDWELWCNSSVYPLYPLLRNGLFHRTSIDGYKGVEKEQYIYPNTGQFKTSYPQTTHYYGFSKGYISLFDFGSGTDEQRIAIHNTWSPFFSDHKPLTVVLELSRADLNSKLIQNSKAPRPGQPGHKGYIPYIEVWYPEPISFSAVIGYIVTIYNPSDRRLHFQRYSVDKVVELHKLISKCETIAEHDSSVIGL